MPTIPAPSPLDRLSAPAPQGRFLSNGSYTVLITSAGTGFSTAGACGLNVWSGDRIEDPDGFFFYIRDAESGLVWSAGDRPARRPAESYDCAWNPGLFEISRIDEGISTRMEACVPFDDPLELRRITLTNRSGRPRRIEITSYIEILLGNPTAHAAHPAFSKLFIRTERIADAALIATRRPHALADSYPCVFHALLDAVRGTGGERRSASTRSKAGQETDEAGDGAPECETDRGFFIGRLRNLANPRALDPGIRLSGTTGDVLDPILSIRRAILLPIDGSAEVTFVLGCARDRGEVLDRIARLGPTGPDRCDAAQNRESQALQALDLTNPEGAYAQEIASSILYGHPDLRCAPSVLERARGSHDDLARLGLSPRRPFAVLHAEAAAGKALLPALLKIHRYWRSLNLRIDLLILCDGEDRIREEVRDLLGDSVFIARSADLSAAARDWLDGAARLVVADRLPDPVNAASFRSGS